MPLWTPPAPCFQWKLSNLTARPAAEPSGAVTVAAGASNTKPGSYTEIISGALVTRDVYAIYIQFLASNTAGDNCEILLDLGYDPTDSDSYTVKIANLMAGHAPGLDGGTANSGSIGGISYSFPLFFPAGTQFGMQAQTNDNTNKNVKVIMHLYGMPRYPVRAGAYCTTFGANTTTSAGVAITPGTSSEGAWTDISGADTTRPYWFWEMGMSTADTSMTNNLIYGMELGVGDGSNKQLVIEEQYWVASANETLAKDNGRVMSNYYDVGAGVRPYVRSQCSGTADSTMTACVYAVGG